MNSESEKPKPQPPGKSSGWLLTLILGGLVAIVACGGLIVVVLGVSFVTLRDETPAIDSGRQGVPVEPIPQTPAEIESTEDTPSDNDAEN